METLKDELPGLYASAQQGLPFQGKADDGSIVTVVWKDTIPRVLFGRGAKGSIIQDPRDAKKRLRKALARQGLLAEEIDNWVARFDELKEDQSLATPDGSVFVKHAIPAIGPPLTSERVDERLSALIAYEFLALLVGKTIYEHCFDEIRQYILTGKSTDRCTVETLGAERYGTFHALDLQIGEEDFTIFVRFFRCLVFSVRFSRFRYLGIDGVYLEDLKKKKSLIAKSRLDASQGKFCVC